jgi:lysyl-tRNA synthetase class 2
MALVEDLYKHTAQAAFGKLTFKIANFEVNLANKWERIDYKQTVLDSTGVDISKAGVPELQKKLEALKIKFVKSDKKGRLIDLLWKSIRKSIAGPAFLIGHPVEVSPLAKRLENKPDFVERYQVILAGSEMGNGYSELNDPVDQAERFKGQQKMRDEGDTEAQMHDEDFVRALEYGMPPVTGFGVSERLFSFLVDKPIREAVLFPLLRPEKNDKN